jgi:hypothetical protein
MSKRARRNRAGDEVEVLDAGAMSIFESTSASEDPGREMARAAIQTVRHNREPAAAAVALFLATHQSTLEQVHGASESIVMHVMTKHARKLDPGILASREDKDILTGLGRTMLLDPIVVEAVEQAQRGGTGVTFLSKPHCGYCGLIRAAILAGSLRRMAEEIENMGIANLWRWLDAEIAIQEAMEPKEANLNG